MRRKLWRLAVRLFAREFVRDMYQAVLGRDADAEGLASYLENPDRPRGPVAVVGALLRSEEFQRRNFEQHAPELARAFYRGVFGREPDREGLEAYTAKLAQKDDLAATLTELLGSEEFKNRTFERIAPDLARAFFLGVLGREADEDGLQSYASRLTQKENVVDALTRLIDSEEFQRRTFERLAPDLGWALVHGALGLDPEQDELESAIPKLTRKEDVANALNGLIDSEAFKNRTFERIAPDLARAFYQGVLGREADEDGLRTYTARLTQKANVADALTRLIDSEEFQRRTFERIAPDLARAFVRGILGGDDGSIEMEALTAKLSQKENVAEALSSLLGSEKSGRENFARVVPTILRASYLAILGREPDEKGMNTYGARLSSADGLKPVLAELLRSDEFRRKYTQAAPNPAASYDQPCWVFLHIHKTAGTSIQRLLAETFTRDEIFYEHHDTLYQRTAAEISRYSVIAGHYNHDSFDYIHRRKLLLFTFLRQPMRRLSSLYHFLRAHEPDHPSFASGMQAANEMDMERFFQDSKIKTETGFWNHMTWAVMGRRQWKEWQARWQAGSEADFDEQQVETVYRPAIRQRLREFAFIGFQEDFDRSVETLYRMLGKPLPDRNRVHHTLEGLMVTDKNFKKIEKQPITDACREAMGKLIQLDDIVYQEAKIFYDASLTAS